MFSEKAMRVAVYAIFLAVVLYIGYFLYDAQVHPLRTVLTVEHAVDTTMTVEGWVVREESVLAGFGSDVTITAGEGEKLSAGESFALRFLGENDQGESEPVDPYPNGKTEPKPYHCPICGTRYYDKGEAKQCRRSHEWQNRSGRR